MAGEDGREAEGKKAKVDSGKIGKRGLKGLLRDGNISGETTTFEHQNEGSIRFGKGSKTDGNGRRAKPLGSVVAARRHPPLIGSIKARRMTTADGRRSNRV